MSWNTLLLEKQNKVAVLKINRPKALNALNADVLTDLIDCLTKLAADKDVDVIVLTGEGGRSFVAGADISAMQPMDAVESSTFARLGQKVFTMVENMPQPVIAAIPGFALGGGNELAISCDFRIASDKAKFGQPEVGIGVTPGWGGTQRLPRLIGQGKARYILYANDIIDAQTALNWGLVDFVVPHDDLMDKAMEIAGKIAKQSAFAVRQTKLCCLRGIDGPLNVGLELEAQAFGVCFATKDQKDRMQAFLDKSKK